MREKTDAFERASYKLSFKFPVLYNEFSSSPETRIHLASLFSTDVVLTLGSHLHLISFNPRLSCPKEFRFNFMISTADTVFTDENVQRKRQ